MFQRLKNSSATSSDARASPESRSLKVESFQKLPQSEESFVEILDRQPSPPAEQFSTDLSLMKKPSDDDHFVDAKDDTKRN